MFRRLTPGLVRTCAVAAALIALTASSGSLSAGQGPPTAQQVIERFIKAIGGRDAYKKITSVRAIGTMEMPAQGIKGTFEMLQARPAKARIKSTTQGIGDIEMGYDGKYGWQIDPLAGPALLTGRKLTELADESRFDGALYEPDFVKSMTVVEPVTFDGRSAHKLHVVFVSGIEEFQFFDTETGLRLGTEAKKETALGVVPTTSYWREYKQFGPLLQPTVLVQRMLTVEQVVRLTSFEYNDVPASAFDMPAQIKALIK